MNSDKDIFDIDESFTDAHDLIDHFLKHENVFAPTQIFDVSELLTSGYMFRGQANKRWKLFPSAHRPNGNPFKSYTPQPPYKSLLQSGEIDIYEFVYGHIHAELRAVLLFLQAADRVGLQTPLDYTQISIHQALFDELRTGKLSKTSIDFPHPSFLPSVALAQHYGVPTRLLDWTESPWIAAYFAAKQASALVAKNKRKKWDFSIIGLGMPLLSQVTSVHQVSVARANNPYLRAQRGVFTIINDASKYYLNNKKWPSIEDIVKVERKASTIFTKSPLIRFSLPASEADKLLRLLYRLDISHLTLMPSLSNAAEHFSYKQMLWPTK